MLQNALHDTWKLTWKCLHGCGNCRRMMRIDTWNLGPTSLNLNGAVMLNIHSSQLKNKAIFSKLSCFDLFSLNHSATAFHAQIIPEFNSIYEKLEHLSKVFRKQIKKNLILIHFWKCNIITIALHIIEVCFACSGLLFRQQQQKKLHLFSPSTNESASKLSEQTSLSILILRIIHSCHV